MSRVAVIGIGLIGGSIAEALRIRGHSIIGFDPHPEARQVAMKRQLTDDVTDSLDEALDGANYVVLCAPISIIIRELPQVDRIAPLDSIILDVASVKGRVVQVMESLTHGERAIGGHPLAGKEVSGAEAAASALISGRPFALCSTSRTNESTQSRAESLVREMGASPIFLSAESHDAIVARTSHVPQLVSTALALCLQPIDLPLAGPGLRGMTRLAASQSDMWIDIACANGSNIAASLRQVCQQLGDLARTLEHNDMISLRRAMERGKEAVGPMREESGT